MPENVEPLEAAVSGLRAKQTEQFLAVEVLAAGRQGSQIHHMVRELRVELARDPEIVSDDASQFHLCAIGRQLILSSDPRARQIFRVTAIEFPFGDALRRGARRYSKKYQC